MTKYYIRTVKKDAKGTIYFNFQKRVPPIRFRLCTHIQVETKVWNAANKNANSWNKFATSEMGRPIVEKLELMQQAVQNLFDQGLLRSNTDKGRAEETILAIINPGVTEIKVEEQKNPKKNDVDVNGNIIQFYEFFMEGITTGKIRYGYNRTYTKNSITRWRSFRKHLLGYCSADDTFEDIDKAYADGFCSYLESLEIMPTTCNKTLICFRKLCNIAVEYGVNRNATSMKVWKERHVAQEEMRAEIYLAEDELEAYYSYPLEGEEEQARDLFIMGYLSCQRYGDYGSFTRENFGMTPGGTPVIKVRQEKNGNYVEVPIVDAKVNEICRKYDFKFPKISTRKFNELLLSVSKQVATVCPSLMEKHVTAMSYQEKRRERRFVELLSMKKRGKKITYEQKRAMAKMVAYAESHHGQPLYERNVYGQMVKYKYELVTSHTARRSGVTNLYKTGLLDTREMMAISGHKTEAIFEHYIKMDVSEHADRIAEKLRGRSR